MKIGFVGAGLVGSTTAYTLAIEGLAQEIVLIDINKTKAEAEADDITHAAALNKTAKLLKAIIPTSPEPELSSLRLTALLTSNPLVWNWFPATPKCLKASFPISPATRRILLSSSRPTR